MKMPSKLGNLTGWFFLVSSYIQAKGGSRKNTTHPNTSLWEKAAEPPGIDEVVEHAKGLELQTPRLLDGSWVGWVQEVGLGGGVGEWTGGCFFKKDSVPELQGEAKRKTQGKKWGSPLKK